MELLAPAGDKSKLIMAIEYGADAVYLASTRFGLRTFAGNFDLDGLKEDIKKASESKRDYEEVPDGDYEVSIQKMELKESSTKKPMLSVWFKIVDGSHKGQLIFMNQLVDEAFKIHIANEFLRGLNTGLNIEFNSFVQYHGLIEQVFEISQSYEYALEYTHNSKGFAEYKITDVFALQ